jgi:hypothetical protein
LWPKSRVVVGVADIGTEKNLPRAKGRLEDVGGVGSRDEETSILVKSSQFTVKRSERD